MQNHFTALSAKDFAETVQNYAWTRSIWRVDLHHTGRPSKADFRGIETLEHMAERHRTELRYADIAQHITIAPDGTIWTGRDWNTLPASLTGRMNAGAFMVALVGNFDRGRDRLDGAQLDSTIATIAAIQQRFQLPVQSLLFHREVPQTEQSSPGTSIEKIDILRRLDAHRRHPRRPAADARAT